MQPRWAIYIDIEGFRALYSRENNILVALCDLMEGIFLIGRECYPAAPDRIFAHQTGDGFVIVGEFGAESLSVPVSIAIALLRHIAARGRFAKAAIGEGDFADISGCYPKALRDAREPNGIIRMGGGIMHLFPVMGTAFIDAVAVMKNSPSGAILSVSLANVSRLPHGCKVREFPANGVATIDWANSSLPGVAALQARANLSQPTAAEIESIFNKYIADQTPPCKWVAGSREAMGLTRGQTGT